MRDRAPVEPTWRDDLERLADCLLDRSDTLRHTLEGLLAPGEVGALRTRAVRLTRAATLPVVREERRPYPWPPL